MIINNVWRGICKGAVMAYLKILSQHIHLERLKKPMNQDRWQTA
jgi:hypothetical protein